MASNGAWGDANDARHSARAKHYDDFHSNPAYQTFTEWGTPLEIRQWLERRALTWEDLDNFGARWAPINGRPVIIYSFPDGTKFRDLTEPEPHRWVTPGEWGTPKMIRRDPEPAMVIVAEGESDAMQLARSYPGCDICCLPIGAKGIDERVIDPLKRYETVLVGLDSDAAGDEGSQMILDALPRTATRMRPPANDWCAAAVEGPLDPDPLAYVNERNVPTFSIREVLAADFGSNEDNNWFEDGILPVGGSLALHGAMKSLKSVVQLDLLRALATGTPFAGPDGYQFINPGGPVVCALIQMEIRPQPFQERLLSFLQMDHDYNHDLFLDNLHVYKVGDGELPRLKIQQAGFKAEVLRFIEVTDAKVIAFDPIQRLTGSANIDKVDELDFLLDFYAELQNDGITVVYTHHNNKSSGPGASHPNSMAGSQRFGADADSICSLTHDPKCMRSMVNDFGVSERNMSWTLRNGAAPTRGITVAPYGPDPRLMDIKFHPPFVPDDPEPSKPPTAPTI